MAGASRAPEAPGCPRPWAGPFHPLHQARGRRPLSMNVCKAASSQRLVSPPKLCSEPAGDGVHGERCLTYRQSRLRCQRCGAGDEMLCDCPSQRPSRPGSPEGVLSREKVEGSLSSIHALHRARAAGSVDPNRSQGALHQPEQLLGRAPGPVPCGLGLDRGAHAGMDTRLTSLAVVSSHQACTGQFAALPLVASLD